MKTPEEITAYIAQRIGCIYDRPLMYGGTGEGVDMLLHTYHEMWSVIVECLDELDKTRQEVHAEENCDSAGFSHHYAENHPDASENDIAQYVVQQWKKISERLGVPIPHAESSVSDDHP